MRLTYWGWGVAIALSSLRLLFGEAVYGQAIAPDGTLPTQVTTPNDLNFAIDGGTQSGNNLFHSFRQFSVPTGGSAVFNNAADIQNIFSRVTGGAISNIDGVLQANGTASVFLLNPNGILFGPNASLNIGGSFVGTTANSIKFADGLIFSSENSGAAPILTVTTPIGLQLGANAGPIQVQGTLQVPTGETLALVGSQIDMTGATLRAPDGRIELWAVQDAQLITNTQPWQIASSATAANWGNITLQQASLVDASGTTYGGGINIRGRGLTLQEQSNIKSVTFSGQGRGITVNTTEFVDLLGSTHPEFPFGFEGISTSVGNSVGFIALPGPPATGRAGDVTVETGRLRVANSAWLQSVTAGNNSRTGDVTVRATDVDVVGFEFLPNFTTSAIVSLIIAGENNQGGQVTVEAERIRLLDGSRISGGVVVGNGRAGDVVIRASESLEIRGATAIGGISSSVLTTLEAGTSGQGGHISIDTGLLTLSEGGAIASEVAGDQVSFFGPLPGAVGTAGSIDIHAREIQVSDPIIDGFSQTLTGITASLGEGATGSGGSIKITADSLHVFDGGQVTTSSLGQGAAGSIDLRLNTLDVRGSSQYLLNGQYLPSAITAAANSSFDAGSVNITADNLQVRNGARITVSNAGLGNAGNLDARARTILLDNGGSLSAEVNGGSQGNIYLQADDTLVLRRGSNITTNAQGASTGGNININARLIAAVPSENSDIVANAVQGNGGNIQITTEGIFGLTFQPEITENSDITASSEFGVNGTVAISHLSVDPNSGLVELPTSLSDSSNQIAQGCSANRGNAFVATGRGGLPANPTDNVGQNHLWSDIRGLSNLSNNATAVAISAPQTLDQPIEANVWYTNSQGQVELAAAAITQPLPQPYATCSASSAPS